MATALDQSSTFSNTSEWFAIITLALPPAVAVLAAVLGAIFVLSNIWLTLALLQKKWKETCERRGGQAQSKV